MDRIPPRQKSASTVNMSDEVSVRAPGDGANGNSAELESKPLLHIDGGSGLQAVLCDFDGTIAYTDHLHFECYNEVLATRYRDAAGDLQMTWPEYAGLLYARDIDVLRMFLESHHIKVLESDLLDMVASKHKLMLSKLAVRPALYPFAEVSECVYCCIHLPLHSGSVQPCYAAPCVVH